jgi:hypothetical protein
MVQSNNLGCFKIASLSREGVAPREGLRSLEGLFAGQLLLGPKAAAWIVFPIEVPRRTSVGKVDLIAPAVRDSLVFDDFDRHGR